MFLAGTLDALMAFADATPATDAAEICTIAGAPGPDALVGCIGVEDAVATVSAEVDCIGA